MNAADRLLVFGQGIIESPAAPSEYLYRRIDGDTRKINLGASLTVCDRECAVVVSRGEIVEILDTGIYRLDHRQLPELERLYSWTADYNGPLHADILFVSMASQPRRVWQCDRESSRLTGIGLSVEASGTLEYRVADCRRFALAVIARRWRTEDDLSREAQRWIVSELRSLCTTMDKEPAASEIKHRDVATRLTRQLQGRFESLGLADVAIGIRQFSVKTENQPEPHTDAQAIAAAAGDNIARLSERSYSEDSLSSSRKESQRPASGGSRESESSSSLEEEIARLDAWTGIAGRAPQAEADAAAERPRTDAAPAVAVLLPESLRETSFYIAVDMQQTGPFDAGEFEQAIVEGVVRRDTLVWFRELDDWKRAGDIDGIALLVRD